MLIIFWVLFSSLRSSLLSRAALQAEILALRHQLLVLQRSTHGRRLHLRPADRIFWRRVKKLIRANIKSMTGIDLRAFSFFPTRSSFSPQLKNA
jgi:hypothetical protein